MGRFDEGNEETMNTRFERVRSYVGDEPRHVEEMEHIGRYVTHGKKIRPEKPTQHDRVKVIPAKKGFHGYVDHPMHFLAGEAGRERIDIHKTKRKHHDDFWDVSEYFGGKY